MKLLATLLFALFLSNYLFAQSLQKGTFQVGASGFPVVYLDSSVPTGYSAKFNCGIFIKNNLSIGFNPFVGKVEDITSFGSLLYLRYYFFNKKRTSVFIDGGIGLGNVRYSESPQFDGYMNSIVLGPGLNYFLSEKLSLEFSLQYARLRNISFPEDTELGNTVLPAIGIQYYFHK
ncbi:MAG: hypothetical protein RLO81_17655 [Fulvivirga sp.]|uniref:hypothetical protein n=1 Tax=Fulvivirga sp. TaxID=1931237 RepID=UPI0032ED5862